MYCIQCGVKLADSQRQCPLCGTIPFHPDLPAPEGQPLYPPNRYPNRRISSRWALIFAGTFFLMPLLISVLCDLQINNAVTWSGYVAGASLSAYVIFVLPFWFRKPNPVIFVPCDFALTGLFLLYINETTQGNWFLSFAFPVIGCVGLIVTTVITLCRYIHRGHLYIFGGAFIALGGFMLLMEFLLNYTFQQPQFLFWSLYPLTALVLLGGFLIFLAICKPAREIMERKMFL